MKIVISSCNILKARITFAAFMFYYRKFISERKFIKFLLFVYWGFQAEIYHHYHQLRTNYKISFSFDFWPIGSQNYMNTTSASNETTLGIPDKVAMKALVGILPAMSIWALVCSINFTLSVFAIFVLQKYQLLGDNFRFLLTCQLCGEAGYAVYTTGISMFHFINWFRDQVETTIPFQCFKWVV